MPWTSDRPRPVPTPDSLGREEWVEDTDTQVRVDPATGIAHFETNVFARGQRAGDECHGRFQGNAFEAHGQRAAALHRLDCVRA